MEDDVNLPQSLTRLKVSHDELEREKINLERVVQERSEQVRKLSDALVAAEERERRRLATVLHDDLQQLLFGAEMKVGMLQLQFDGSDGHAELLESLKELKVVIHRSIKVTRTLSLELTPPIDATSSLEESLEWLCGHMERQYNLKVVCTVEDRVGVTDPSLTQYIVQIIREMLFNVVKHSGEQTASVNVTKGQDHLQLVVCDEGSGFPAEEVLAEESSNPSSLGLRSVQERVELLGGSLTIESDPGEGTTARILIPNPEKSA